MSDCLVFEFISINFIAAPDYVRAVPSCPDIVILKAKNAFCGVTLDKPKISCRELSGSPKIYAIITTQ